MKTREWRFAVWNGRELLPFTGQIAWEEKRLLLKSQAHTFTLKGVYPALFADPGYPYTLLRVYLRPLRITPDSEKKGIQEIEFEYFHRKETCEE